MNKHEHRWVYDFGEYISAVYILRLCDCGKQEEALIEPDKFKPVGNIELRASSRPPQE